MFNSQVDDETVVYLSMSDSTNPLSSFSAHVFNLDGFDWPTAEHYYQAMRFNKPELQKKVCFSESPQAARRLAKRHFWRMRFDWKKIREVYMTRAVYTKCLTHDAVAKALLATGDKRIIEVSQYDYYWGRGRDGRGLNTYGTVLMNVRGKLLDKMAAGT